MGAPAAGILQRARLIDAVLADLHGKQRLLQDGSLPASLLLGSPAFVRTSVDREAPERRFLYAYACDVARTASGEWVVLGDQTDTAIGNGYVAGQPGGAQPRLGAAVPRLPHAAPRRLLPRRCRRASRGCAGATTGGSCS